MIVIFAINVIVTFFQLVAVAIAYFLFNVGFSGLCLTAMGTAGFITLAMTIGTREEPARAHTHGMIGFIALSAAIMSLSSWLWTQDKDFLAFCGLTMVGLLTELFVQKARHWSKRPYEALFVTALPNIGVILGIIVGIFILIKEVAEEL